MTKAELVEKMAKDAKITKTAAGKVLDSFVVTFKPGKALRDKI